MEDNVRQFDSFEEAQEFMRENERRAVDNTHPFQWKIAYDDQRLSNYVIRLYEMGGDQVLIIFGKLLSFAEEVVDFAPDIENMVPEPEDLSEEAKENLRQKALKAGADHAEEMRSRGYVNGWWASVIEVRGEPGGAHVSTLMPCTQETYEHYQAHQWDVHDRKVLREDPLFAPALLEMAGLF